MSTTAAPTAAALSETVRRQRDRFVGFAFAAADLLLEVDAKGTITFAAGAARGICERSAEALVGTRFSDLLARPERALTSALMSAIGRGGRFPPVPVKVEREGSPTVMLGGCALPDRPDRLFLSLSVAPSAAEADAAPKRLDRKGFAEAALGRVQEGGRGDLKLTFVAVEELDQLRERLSAEVAEGLGDAIVRYIGASASGAEATGELAPGRYGVLHRGVFDPDRLRDNAQALARVLIPGGEPIELCSKTLDIGGAPGMVGSDAARALAYCIESFAAASIDELSELMVGGGLEQPVADAAARVASLRATVQTQSFSLVVQPIVDIKTRKIHHVEALARFDDGQSPGPTLAFAEKVRLIADFDLAVCVRVLKALETGALGALAIAVNISGRSLEDPSFVAALFELLRPAKVYASRLLFEITESATIQHPEQADTTVQKLRNMGFRVCLDDFGEGASSLRYLRAFDVDFIKIDGTFVRNAMEGKQRDQRLLGHVAAYCRDAGIKTIAEMIESPEQVPPLQALGITHGQGWHYGQPQPLVDFGAAALPKRAKIA